MTALTTCPFLTLLSGVASFTDAREQRQEGAGRQGGQDRKSTRLNPSHVSISYAVFCLKKKKPMTISTTPIARRTSFFGPIRSCPTPPAPPLATPTPPPPTSTPPQLPRCLLVTARQLTS